MVFNFIQFLILPISYQLFILVFSRVSDYSLGHVYQLSENQLTIRIILPCSVLHGILYASYLLAQKLIREGVGHYAEPKVSATIFEGTHIVRLCSYWQRLADPGHGVRISGYRSLAPENVRLKRIFSKFPFITNF